MVILIFIAGLVLLITGAEALVRGASRLAGALGISPLIIGLTVVSFGTSSPELAVSIKSAIAGQADIAVGNVIGSNIFNILFILGLSALVAPLIVSRQLLRLDVPLMIGVSVLALLLGLDGTFSRLEGSLLFAGLFAYIWLLIKQGRVASEELKKEYAGAITGTDKTARAWTKDTLFIIGGLVLLVIGAKWLVDSAVTIATYLGVSELVIGLTIIAAGTSLPEVVTSVIASLRGERDIAVGNVVGSNIFNIMCVLGLTSVIAPSGIAISSSVISFDIPIMIAAACICLPIFFTGEIISRREGALLLGYYAAYTLYLILATSHHDALAGFSAVMLYFVIPLTVLTLLIASTRELHNRSRY